MKVITLCDSCASCELNLWGTVIARIEWTCHDTKPFSDGGPTHFITVRKSGCIGLRALATTIMTNASIRA